MLEISKDLGNTRLRYATFSAPSGSQLMSPRNQVSFSSASTLYNNTAFLPERVKAAGCQKSCGPKSREPGMTIGRLRSVIGAFGSSARTQKCTSRKLHGSEFANAVTTDIAGMP